MMIRSRTLFFSACLLLACAAGARQPKCFHVFDATAYVGKPDLTRRGIEPTNAFEPDRWWPKGANDDDLPDPDAVHIWMPRITAHRGLLVLDLERWWLRGDRKTVQEGLRRYLTVLDWVRSAGYMQPIGYYGVIPTYHREAALQGEGTGAYAAWRKENDAVQPLADRVDVLFPSLYTDEEDVATWERFATAVLREARRLAHGKPVYPFIWPQYVQSKGPLSLTYIPRSQWARELQVIGDNADGVVIWGGIGRTASEGTPKWDESAPWWQQTLAFLAVRGTCGGTQ